MTAARVALVTLVFACEVPGGPTGDVELGESYAESCACSGGALAGDQLLLGVNRAVGLSSTYEPSVVAVPAAYGSGRLRPLALGYFMQMADAARAETGRRFQVGSPYRSFCTQCGLFASYAATWGEEEANTFSARAGHSEHQLGTTMDIVDEGGFIGGPYDIPAAPADPELYTWLDEHAWAYGFVNSYPPNDADRGDRFASRTYAITGYIPEPWHWRFVGKRAAEVHRLQGERAGLRISTHELIATLGDAAADLEAPHPDDAAALARAGGGTPSEPPGCASQTLGRTVASGSCVQVSYAGCALERCAWFRCDAGQWTCAAPDGCSGEEHAHSSCQ
jgi:LAS superfamily LD-carboxypeptidase LdcB